MGFVGKNTEPLDKAASQKNYEYLRKTNLFFGLQNAFKQLKAEKYCQKLFEEVPDAKEAVRGKLAIVTGVTIGGAGFHVAQELALSAGMHVIIMGRSEGKLKKAEEAITAEASKRGLPEPTLYHVLFDLDDLTTAVSAADWVQEIATSSYHSQLHVLVNNAGASVNDYRLTKQGVEANVGRNFLAPHLLSEKLLGLLEAAATATYKPRCVFVASLAYCLSPDLDPDNLLASPELGGAPTEGFWKFAEQDGKQVCKNNALDMVLMYGRGKLGDVASAHYMAQKYPKICFVSQHPGSIVSNFGSGQGVAAMIYYYGFYMFQYSPAQGATTSLRAALDPDFNTEVSLQGAYLHADCNPWTKDDLTIDDPDTSKPYEWDKYAERVYNKTNELIEKLLLK